MLISPLSHVLSFTHKLFGLFLLYLINRKRNEKSYIILLNGSSSEKKACRSLTVAVPLLQATIERERTATVREGLRTWNINHPIYG